MDDLLIGQQLGNYRIDSVIGRGGMATVYYGFDERLHRPVAVKVIDARYRDSPDYAKRFVQEARTVATWRHDNILQVYHAGQEGEIYYFAMEYVDGLDLGKVMKQLAAAKQMMLHEDVLEIGRAVANALDYAHSQGVIHRDVKPSNVMLARGGPIILADFGLALNQQQGSIGGIFGTAHYIAPEQARRSDMAVPQSDIYSLGVMVYEMLTGSVPFDDPSPTSLAFQHLTQPPPPPRQLNPELNLATEQVLLKVLSKRPEDRYQTGAELMDALTEALQAPDVAETRAALPPSQPGESASAQSRTTVADRISRHILPPPVAIGTSRKVTRPGDPPAFDSAPTVTFPPEVSPPAATKLKRSTVFWTAAGVGIALLLVAAWLLFGAGNEGTAETVSPPDPSPTSFVSEAAGSSEVDTVQSPSADTLPTGTAAVSATEPLPTETAVPEPTESPLPESTSPPPTAAPTALPAATPSGTRLIMFYDPTSFYLYNPNRDTEVRVSALSFESLDANGLPSGQWFEGRRWSQFYSFVESFGCVGLEITGEDSWLRPSQCRVYNAVITPDQEGDIVFWTQRAGVTRFRVLWQEREIGLCDVNATQCEAYLP